MSVWKGCLALKHVLYIHPESNKSGGSDIVVPAGLIGVLNEVKKISNFGAINLPLEKRINSSFNILDDELIRAADIILIDLHWYVFSHTAIELSRQIKAIRDNAVIVLGGITASIFSLEIMNTFSFVDFTIRGDAEKPLLMLIEWIDNPDNFCYIPNLCYRLNDGIHFSEHVYVGRYDKSLNSHDISWMRHSDEFLRYQGRLELSNKNGTLYEKLAWIQNAKGCDFNCSYCGGTCDVFKNFYSYDGMRFKPVTYLISEFEQIHAKGIYKIGITHDLGLQPKKDLHELCNYMIRKNIKFGIANFCFQLPDLEFARIFNKMVNQENSIIGIPIICGDELLRARSGKCYSNKEIELFLESFTNSDVLIVSGKCKSTYSAS